MIRAYPEAQTSQDDYILSKARPFPSFSLEPEERTLAEPFAGWMEEGGICISIGYLSRLTATGELLVITLCTPVATALPYVSFYCQCTPVIWRP